MNLITISFEFNGKRIMKYNVFFEYLKKLLNHELFITLYILSC
jgi:hypothetical protein